MSTIQKEPNVELTTVRLGDEFKIEGKRYEAFAIAAVLDPPVVLQVSLPTGGSRTNATDPSRDISGPQTLIDVAKDDVITSSISEPAVFKGTNDELSIVLQPGGQARIREDDDGAKFLFVDLEIGRVTVASKQYLTGALGGSVLMSGPGRKFIVRAKHYAFGSNGTCYSVAVLSSTMAKVYGHEGTITVCPETSSLDPYPERSVSVDQTLVVEGGRDLFYYPIVSM